MNFLSFEYFLYVCEEGTLSATARKLSVSQQAISEHLKNLENYIGMPLFKRTQPITLTEAGQALVFYGRKMLDIRSKMLSEVKKIADKEDKRLVIAIPLHANYQFLLDIYDAFSTAHQLCAITTVKRPINSISENMTGVDLFMCQTPFDEKLTNVPICEDDMFCVVLTRQLFKKIYGDEAENIMKKAERKRTLDFAQKLPFILLVDRWGQHAKYSDQIFKEAGITPTVSFQSESDDLNFSLCFHGIGAYLSSYYIALGKARHAENKNDILLFPIKTNSLQSILAISYEKGKVLSRAEEDFIRCAKEYIKEDFVR